MSPDTIKIEFNKLTSYFFVIFSNFQNLSSFENKVTCITNDGHVRYDKFF